MDHHRPSSEPAAPWLVWAGLLVVYIVWGSTYLAIRLVVETMPPLLAASGRFLTAGAIMALVLVVRRGPGVFRLSRAELAGAALVGVALLLGGNGLVSLGERDVPSGLAALIIAVVPLWVVIWRLINSERVRRGTLIGVVVGFAGVAVLVIPRGFEPGTGLVGMIFLLISGFSWATGSYYSRRLSLPADPFVSTACQLLLGGVALGLAGIVTGELGLMQVERFSTGAVVSLVYLVFIGSILAYTTYTWLLQNTSVSNVATYAYVNPVVALLLGWLVLDEQINAGMVIGGSMIVVAVAVVIRSEVRSGAARRAAAARADAAAATPVPPVTGERDATEKGDTRPAPSADWRRAGE